MTKYRTPVVLTAAVWLAGSVGRAQSGREGHVNYLAYAQPFLDPFTSNFDPNTQQWFQKHFSSMVSYSPYADQRNWWWPRTYVYRDLYGIPFDSAIVGAHPEWILKDQYGNWLYVPWGCQNGICPLYAGDVANPDYRAYVVGDYQAMVSRGNYAGVFLDDSNMEFRVSDGWMNQTPPVDTSTGQLMTFDAWRNYIATFAEQIRAAFPGKTQLENVIWWASGGSGVAGQDIYIQRLLKAANVINLERGVANDRGLTGGTGFWSVYNFFNFIDTVHATGAGVNFEQYDLDRAGQESGLASWFLISNGSDSLDDSVSTPANWFSGYDLDLGAALGPRTYNSGIFQRHFTGGIVLLAEPGLPGQTISLPGTFQTLDGSSVTSVYLEGGQGAVLIGNQALVTQSAAALLSASGDGTVQGAIQHSGNYRLVSPDDPAAAGEAIIIYWTGLSDQAGIPPMISIGGEAAQVLWFGQTPGYDGLDQVNVIVPNDLVPGPAIPVRMTYLSQSTNEVTIAIQ